MKVNELLMNIHNKEFNLKRDLQVKKYLPMEVKKTIAQGIIYECTSDEDSFIKVDSVLKYMSYVRYMITMHTNLEYTDDDYDIICSTEYADTNLFNAIMDCFGEDAKECYRILDLMFSDYIREIGFEVAAAKFLNKLADSLGDISEILNEKINGLDLKNMIPEDVDVNKLNELLSKYVK
jgi:hypothetical protein